MTQKDQLLDGQVKPVKDAAAGEETARAAVETGCVSARRKKTQSILFSRDAASKSSRIMGGKKLGERGTFIASLTVSPSAPNPSRSLFLLCDTISACRRV